MDLPLWQLVLYTTATVILIAVMVGGSAVLGERHRDYSKAQPFESGIIGVGYARFRFPVQFYLIAMFFVIFDLESVFVFAWAISFRAVGWPGYVEIVIFIVILLAALAYLWRLGALEWGPKRKIPALDKR